MGIDNSIKAKFTGLQKKERFDNYYRNIMVEYILFCLVQAIKSSKANQELFF